MILGINMNAMAEGLMLGSHYVPGTGVPKSVVKCVTGHVPWLL